MPDKDRAEPSPLMSDWIVFHRGNKTDPEYNLQKYFDHGIFLSHSAKVMDDT